MDITPGMQVTIKKGTVIQTPTHPTTKTKVAARTYKITVKYMQSPQAMPVGYRSFSASGEVISESVKMHSEEDRRTLHAFLGREVTDEELLTLVEEGGRYPRDNETSYCNLFVPMAPAKIGWSGAGGYWNEVPLADVSSV